MSETDFSERLKTTGRNDPCPCGSGKKYKKCHLREDEQKHHEIYLKEEEERQKAAEEAAANEEESGDEKDKQNQSMVKPKMGSHVHKQKQRGGPVNTPRRGAI